MAYLLNIGDEIGNFRVKFPIKNNRVTQTYRVENDLGERGLLKIYVLADLDKRFKNDSNEIREISNLKRLNGLECVPKILGSGRNESYGIEFVITEFVSGETLTDLLIRQKVWDIVEANKYFGQLSNALKRIHDTGILHNEISTDNILVGINGKIDSIYFIDFGASCCIDEWQNDYIKPEMSPYFCATETFSGSYSIKSDIFSLCATYFYAIFGEYPWQQINLDSFASRNKLIEAVIEARSMPIELPLLYDNSDVSWETLSLGLENSVISRLDDSSRLFLGKNLVHTEKNLVKKIFQPRTKKGFDGIAGMQDLKNQLQEEVIEALLAPEDFKKYKLAIPNGLLLYGPPGCGKTFFAKQFAEEAKLNFFSIKPSDLGSTYVHGSQGKIAALFDQARKDAPCILFFDELDALLPKRTEQNQHAASEVNEFLAQMDNLGEYGIFIIGATNRKDMIDPAILRSGRLDYKVYIPPPDFEARKALFQFEILDRPNDGKIDFEELSSLTEGFVSSDIRLIVDRTARIALRNSDEISHDLLLQVVAESKPSISNIELFDYQGSTPNKRKDKIGFK